MTAPDAAARTLATARVLPVPAERLWQAFADPAQLARWWGPDGFTNEFAAFDFVPGGVWNLTMVGPDGTRYWNESRFAELVPARRVVVEHRSAPRFDLSVTLDAVDGGTRVGWSQCFETEALCRAVAPVCVPANEQNLDRLLRVVTGAAP